MNSSKPRRRAPAAVEPCALGARHGVDGAVGRAPLTGGAGHVDDAGRRGIGEVQALFWLSPGRVSAHMTGSQFKRDFRRTYDRGRSDRG
jgi:hypothetical protein